MCACGLISPSLSSAAAADRSSVFSLSLPPPLSPLSINRHLSGGLDTIFNGEKEKRLQVEAVARTKGDDDDDQGDQDGDSDGGGDNDQASRTSSTTTVARVAAAAAALADPGQAHMLFVKGSETVRPGVLVLVNDADWELCGGPGARVGAGDRVTFISTLHGG